jgi:hypothetical protein
MNPHILQNKNRNCRHAYERIVNIDDSKGLKYQYVPRKKYSTIHHGQRKLLISEIEFMTLHSNPGDIVVYVGAADGEHINDLVKMFPDITYYLYDMRNEWNIKESDNVHIYTLRNGFDVDQVKNLDLTNMLFISDIRTNETDDEAVVRDMNMQMNWVLQINPKASLLKFRFPWHYHQDKINYLDGDLYYQAFAKHTSAETRLMSTRPYSTKEYDWDKYNDVLYNFNMNIRPCLYPHESLTNPVWYRDKCYDCATETYVVRQYLRRLLNRDPSDTEISNVILNWSLPVIKLIK